MDIQKKLDYTDIRPLPDNWFAVDSFMRKKEEELRLPKEFEEKLNKNEGKLIYFVLGSMGSIDVQLMKRLVNILSKTKHKFIVSKGFLGELMNCLTICGARSLFPKQKYFH